MFVVGTGGRGAGGGGVGEREDGGTDGGQHQRPQFDHTSEVGGEGNGGVATDAATDGRIIGAISQEIQVYFTGSTPLC